jgi:Ca2+-dependent lipid-binding protein
MSDACFQSLVVRVYVLRAMQLKATDIGGSSDPYLVLKYGPGLGTKIVDKKRYS